MPKSGVKKGGEYIAHDCIHLNNMLLYAYKGSKFVLAQVNRYAGERN